MLIRLVPVRSPPGLGVAAEQHDDGAGTGTTAVGVGDTATQPGAPDCGGDPGLPVDGAESIEGDFGQVDGASGSLSRHGSPGPVVPSHCEGDTMAIGGAWPGGSLGDISSEGPVQGHVDTPMGCSATGAHDERVLLSPLGAVCVGGGASSATQQGLRDGSGGANGLPGDGDAAHHDGALRVKLETEARPSPSGVGEPAGDEATVGALPVPSGVSDGDTSHGAADGRLLEGAPGADDGLPSFSPVDGEPASPTGPEEAVLGTAAVHDAGDEGVTARGRDLPLFAGADGGQEEGGRDDGTRSPGADADGFPSCAGATGAGAQPHGVVSLPATTVFCGGIGGVAPTSDAADNANIAHSVPLDSDSDNDLGVSAPATTAADGKAASGGPGDAPSPPGLEGAHQ